MNRLSVAVSALILTLAPSIAMADVIPPDVEGCTGKKTGDSCTVSGTSGTGLCVDATCSKTRPNADGGAPITEEYACVKCSFDAGAPVGDASVPTADSGILADSGAKADSGSTADAGSSPDTDTTESDSSSSCSVAMRPVGSLAIAGLVPLALALAGRRRRRS
jgi:MYXO-CTERM domain-containing protein